MRLLLDEGVPLRAAATLRERGVAAEHVLELELRGQPDEAILASAYERSAAVVAFDSDFHKILADSGAKGPSVIRLRVKHLGHEALAELVCDVLERVSDALERGAVGRRNPYFPARDMHEHHQVRLVLPQRRPDALAEKVTRHERV